MASIGKLAKPAWIPMSQREWDMLDEAHQRKLASEGRTSASLPQPFPASAAAQPPVEIHSPKAKALLERIAQGKEHTWALQQLWLSLELCSCPPDSRQFGIWFVRHEFETVASSFEATAVWLSKLRGGEHPEYAGQKTHDDKIRYASACMNKLVKGEDE
jgi:hypothetical protein